MDTPISDKEKSILSNLCEKLVKQGSFHRENIVEYFGIMINATKNEFTEDNQPTVNAFMVECLEEAISRSNK